nr:hypothetical protein [Bradyrhizobium icense]
MLFRKPGKIGKVPIDLSERSDCCQFESTCFVWWSLRRGVPTGGHWRESAFPGFGEPALATSIEKVPSGDRWIHEIKFDGYRVQVNLVNEAVKILTRRGHDWTKRFRKVADDAWHIRAGSAVIDGEIVVPAANGTTDFSVLKRIAHKGIWVEPELLAEIECRANRAGARCDTHSSGGSVRTYRWTISIASGNGQISRLAAGSPLPPTCITPSHRCR